MTTLTIEIPEKVEKTLAELVEQLGGRVILKKGVDGSNKSKKKQQVLDDLEKSLKWVKLHQEGKVEAKTIDELLNEL